MVDNTKWVDKRNTNEPQKKHSFFGWSLDVHKKDLLDFRYNTQEETKYREWKFRYYGWGDN